MRNIVFMLISCLSVFFALILLYDLVKELRESMSVFEINFLPLLAALIVFSNGILGFLLLTGKIKPHKPLFILQIVIILFTGFLLYDIMFNSTVSCS